MVVGPASMRGLNGQHVQKVVVNGTVFTTILPNLFLYLNTVIVTAGDFEP
jgi:hypothetical protein